ncbi:MAG: hypothetical protein F4X14_11045 [Caldilineaceae bacterium SB0661_bin_32]|uniref:Yip1 domain-containing protein n=1 Tax=Caldilineaceae bacterium SB0661_bin_32 TaxID=2605255 RepID=A0A6B1D7F7_9CHLR|nr:hypothetical protein [Caldilineaceae bacterium SB0661_bin_32]
MHPQLISMLKTWKNVLTRPGEKSFAAERSRSSATLKTALAWILLAGVIAALLDILLAALTEMWVISPSEVEFSHPSDFVVMITQPFIYLRIELLHLYFEFAKLYGWLWFHSGLFELVGNSVYRMLNFIVVDIPGWQREIAGGLLKPVSFLVKVGMYHCIALLFGGRGRFGRYAYLLAAFGAPILILNSLLDYMPLAVARLAAVLPGSSFMAGQNWYYTLMGSAAFAVSLIVLAYWLVLFYFSMKVEHGMTWWRAVTGVAASYLVIFVYGAIWPYGLVSGLMEAAELMRRG